VDVQAGLDPCWSQKQYAGFVMAWLNFILARLWWCSSKILIYTWLWWNLEVFSEQLSRLLMSLQTFSGLYPYFAPERSKENQFYQKSIMPQAIVARWWLAELQTPIFGFNLWAADYH
jgi:hypothetical protein